LAVLLSIRRSVVHGKIWYGGVQVTTRQEMAVVPPISWWHCPYRNTLQHVRRRLQSPSAHRQPQGEPLKTLQSV
jgi:hypothetical protein